MKASLRFAGPLVLLGLGCSSGSSTGNPAASETGSGVDGGGEGADAGAAGDASAKGRPANADAAAPGADEGGAAIPTAGGIFEKPQPWSMDVSALTKDARSDAIIAALASEGGWGNGNALQIDFSILLQVAGASTPRQAITAPSKGQYCYGGPDCDAVPLQMPLPANGNTEGSANYTCNTAQNDCHVLVVEKDEKKLYELYNATRSGSAFTALGAFVWDLTKAYPDDLRGDQCTSADAAGFPIAALLPTADEVATGQVKHAVRFILPNDRMKTMAYVHPASHAGAPSSANANAPPYGVRLRLKAAYSEAPFNAGEKVIIRAMKTYGMLLSDGGNVALTFGDDRLDTAKWASQGITAQSFKSIAVTNFEVVDLGAEIALTDNCVRNR